MNINPENIKVLITHGLDSLRLMQEANNLQKERAFIRKDETTLERLDTEGEEIRLAICAIAFNEPW